jgi:predicted DNA-binding protein
MGGNSVNAHEDQQQEALRDAQATVAAEQIQRSLAEGSMTFSDYSPGEGEQALATLAPADLEATSVPTSIRLPYPLYQQLRAYAEAHGTTASTLIRQWVEQMLTVPDRPISLADALRVLSTLPSQGQQAA